MRRNCVNINGRILDETDRNNFNVKLRMIKFSIVECIIFCVLVKKEISWHLNQSENPPKKIKKESFFFNFYLINFRFVCFFGIISTINLFNCFCLALSCFIFMFMSPRSLYCYFRGFALVMFLYYIRCIVRFCDACDILYSSWSSCILDISSIALILYYTKLSHMRHE